MSFVKKSMSTFPPSHFAPSQRISHFAQDVWSIFSPMALHCKAVNLGQGFPNFEAPEFIKNAASDAIKNNINQYSPPKGLSSLRNALSSVYSPLFQRCLNPETEIIVTSGANEGILSIFQAYLDRDDEVILFEPFFDQYAPNITMSDGKLVYCPLRPRQGLDTATQTISAKDWIVDIAELESKVTAKTRMIVLNTPHNPIGKVFSEEELKAISAIVIKYNLLVVSDEVYETLIYPGAAHSRIATLPGMWDRTITVGSGGKSFAVTGWRIGWLIAHQDLIYRALIAHSRIVFCTNSPLQEAVASAFNQASSNGFFEKQCSEYLRKRDYLVETFKEIGLSVTIPDGSYFILVNIDRLDIDEQELAEGEATEALFCQDGKVPPRSRDWKVCRWLTTKIGVAAIPPSEFYGPDNSHLAASYARFCFCKTDETLEAARERLLNIKQYIKK